VNLFDVPYGIAKMHKQQTMEISQHLPFAHDQKALRFAQSSKTRTFHLEKGRHFFCKKCIKVLLCVFFRI